MSNNNNTNDYTEREGRVLELYAQGKSTREIAKELRMSLRDIGFILKKGQANHGIATMMDDGNKAVANRLMKNLPKLTNSLVRKEACRGGYPIKPVRKGSHQILHRILEAKAPIQFISYLPGIKGKSFLYPEAMQVGKKTRNNS